MRIFIYTLLCLVVFSCKSKKTNNIVATFSNAVKDTFNYESNYDKSLDIADLTKYKDTSKFIARLRYSPVFKIPSIIELSEIANGINLCVKQPVEILMQGEVADPDRSLAFNQLCYWYADKGAQEIKNLFKPFSNGQKLRDINCENCLDQSSWQIEIYNHGIYSSIFKNYETENDSTFISIILSKVKLSAKKLSIQGTN